MPGYKKDKQIHKPNNLKYSFDFMEDEVKSWKCGYITRGQLAMLPYGFFQFSSFDKKSWISIYSERLLWKAN